MVVEATGQALEPDSDALFAAPQPSIEQAGDAVVYTETMTPLVQMLCRGSLNGSGRSEAARANKRARERERKQRKKARKALQLAAPEEILSRASLRGGVRASRKRRQKMAEAVAVRVVTRPLQPTSSVVEPPHMELDHGWKGNALTEGLFTAFQSLAEANRITDELEMAAGLQREVTAHQVWQGDELVISNVHSQLH